MQQISQEPEGNHKSWDQTPPREVHERSIDASIQNSQESDNNREVDSEVFFYNTAVPLINERSSDDPCQTSQDCNVVINKPRTKVFHGYGLARLFKESSHDTSDESSQESDDSNETDSEICGYTTDYGSYIENDHNQGWDSGERDDDGGWKVSAEEEYSKDYDEEEYPFQSTYLCYPLSSEGKYSHLECGNQMIMPQSALEPLLETEIKFPMLFEIRKDQADARFSHCGVNEFTAEEGKIYLPKWMMKNLELEEGDSLHIKSTDLETGTYMKLQPHSTDFLSISNPKAALEGGLINNYFCLTTGDTIMINCEGKSFYINIVETKPASAIMITNTDCEVDFDLPLDYKDPEKAVQPAKEEEAATAKPKFLPFTGLSRRLCENFSAGSDISCAEKEQPAVGVAEKTMNESISKGIVKEKVVAEMSRKEQFIPFTGKKYTLRG